MATPWRITGGITEDTGVTAATISTDIALGDDLTVSVADTSATLTILGELSGNYGLTKTGAGTLVLDSENTLQRRHHDQQRHADVGHGRATSLQ